MWQNKYSFTELTDIKKNPVTNLSLQEKSFFFPGSQPAGRPAASKIQEMWFQVGLPSFGCIT